ncbi:MAG: TerB family tellurite resistance protein, partial [Allomuricauda sp.]
MGTHKEKLSILSEMIAFARVDHSLKDSEYQFLLGVASHLGIDKETFDGLLNEKSPKVVLKSQAERIVQF